MFTGKNEVRENSRTGHFNPGQSAASGREKLSIRQTVEIAEIMAGRGEDQESTHIHRLALNRLFLESRIALKERVQTLQDLPRSSFDDLLAAVTCKAYNDGNFDPSQVAAQALREMQVNPAIAGG